MSIHDVFPQRILDGGGTSKRDDQFLLAREQFLLAREQSPLAREQFLLAREAGDSIKPGAQAPGSQ